MNQRKFCRILFSLAFAIAMAVVVPTMTQAQTIRVNWSQKAPYSDYTSFTWIPSKDTNHPFYRQYVGQYVKAALIQKGLKEVAASQSPAILVTYHFLTQEMMDTETSGFGDGGGWGGWGMGMGGMGMGGMGMENSTTSEVPVTIGILTVDLVDAKSKKLVWRGQATTDNVIKNSKGEQKEVAKAIHKMFDHYPPK